MDNREEFRDRVRSFYLGLEQQLDGIDGPIPRARAYRAALVEAGLAGLSYPTAVGGQGLEPDFEAAFREASLDLLPPEDSMLGIGIGMALPTIHELVWLCQPSMSTGLRRPSNVSFVPAWQENKSGASCTPNRGLDQTLLA